MDFVKQLDVLVHDFYKLSLDLDNVGEQHGSGNHEDKAPSGIEYVAHYHYEGQPLLVDHCMRAKSDDQLTCNGADHRETYRGGKRQENEKGVKHEH